MNSMEINKIRDNEWEIPKEGNMNVPCRIFASKKLLDKMKQDRTLEQGKNVAALPGIYKYSIVLPDGHEGYGFSIGGVAALDIEKGGISPGGIGYDINCGVRLLSTNLDKKEIYPKIKELLESLMKHVPAGLGSSSRISGPDQVGRFAAALGGGGGLALVPRHRPGRHGFDGRPGPVRSVEHRRQHAHSAGLGRYLCHTQYPEQQPRTARRRERAGHPSDAWSAEDVVIPASRGTMQGVQP